MYDLPLSMVKYGLAELEFELAKHGGFKSCDGTILYCPNKVNPEGIHVELERGQLYSSIANVEWKYKRRFIESADGIVDLGSECFDVALTVSSDYGIFDGTYSLEHGMTVSLSQDARQICQLVCRDSVIQKTRIYEFLKGYYDL
jgi:hypothetical protein